MASIYLQDIYIALLSGLTSYDPDHPNEIMWKNYLGESINIEIVDLYEERYIIKSYREDGSLSWINNCKGQLADGDCFQLNIDGKITHKYTYENGYLINVDIHK